jgi:hypothetical protein
MSRWVSSGTKLESWSRLIQLKRSHRRRVRARSLAATKAGAVAFSRTGDPNMGEFADAVVLFTAGEVPEDAMNC